MEKYEAYSWFTRMFPHARRHINPKSLEILTRNPTIINIVGELLTGFSSPENQFEGKYMEEFLAQAIKDVYQIPIPLHFKKALFDAVRMYLISGRSITNITHEILAIDLPEQTFPYNFNAPDPAERWGLNWEPAVMIGGDLETCPLSDHPECGYLIKTENNGNITKIPTTTKLIYWNPKGISLRKENGAGRDHFRILREVQRQCEEYPGIEFRFASTHEVLYLMLQRTLTNKDLYELVDGKIMAYSDDEMIDYSIIDPDNNDKIIRYYLHGRDFMETSETPLSELKYIPIAITK